MLEKVKLEIEYYGLSDVGIIRSENQDTLGKFPIDSNDIYQPKGVLFITADGMGGHENGKDASSIAVDTVSTSYFACSIKNNKDAIQKAFETANDMILNHSEKELQVKKMGTTCSTLILKGNHALTAHIGDSRIYAILSNNIKQITHDHTAAEEMFRKGILSKEEVEVYPNKSVLVRAMGVEPKIDIEINDHISIKPGDYFVLCSDGLSQVNITEIKEIVESNAPEESCKILVGLANERGGKDNVTVQVIKIKNKDLEKKYLVEKGNRNPLLKLLSFSVIIIFLIVLIYLFA